MHMLTYSIANTGFSPQTESLWGYQEYFWMEFYICFEVSVCKIW